MELISAQIRKHLDVVSVEEMRRRDAETIAAGTPGRVLMRRAAEGIYNAWEQWPDGTLILCGSGNNGGDGYALAEILSEKNISCRILKISDPRTEDATYYEQHAIKAGVPIQRYEAGCSLAAPVIVDCLLGTGFQGEVREPYASAIRAINRAHENGSKVISADINSGMNGDDGSGQLVVQSDLTVTIGLLKNGFYTEAGRTHYNVLKLAEIGII
ncbi:MAG: NAD(P)H-hydrate epimerase [Lachnospiraceae bacterium]|nr:NAD(P)H-hydrate epimerase [Lachnospiraceae bacterium]